MRVSRITPDGDWTFGRGKADYIANTEAIRQNVVTRLRSFKNDWYADVNHGIEWFGLLGNRANQKSILAAIEDTVLNTDGVSTITKLRILHIDSDRKATIELSFTTIFQQSTTLEESIIL